MRRAFRPQGARAPERRSDPATQRGIGQAIGSIYPPDRVGDERLEGLLERLRSVPGSKTSGGGQPCQG